MTQVYLAGPFFNDEQVAEVEQVEQLLQSNPSVTDFFSPRTEEVRDEVLGSPAWAGKIYHKDIQALKKADVVVAIVDFVDDHVDSGTAFEIGYAVQAKIPVIVLQMKGQTLNLMIGESLHYYTRSLEELRTYDFTQRLANQYQGPTF